MSEPTEPTAPANPAAPNPPARPETPVGFSADYVRDLREENKGWRLKATEQENLRKQAEESVASAKKDADDRVKALEEQVATARTEAQKAADQRVIMAELRVAAVKAGMVDLDGLKLADLTSVKLDDKGDVIGADVLMTSLKEAKPYLFGAPPSGTSSTSEPPPRSPPQPKAAKDMTADEYRAARAAAVR